MTLKECYQILQLSEGASIDEVKKAYRKRAFELHPDLHPDKPDASKRFQRLNEAYVLLTKSSSGSGGARRPGPSSSSAETEAARDKARRAYSKAKQSFDASQQSEQQTGQKQAAGSRNARTEAQYQQKQEDVLNDILKDPFARRVFEDIYSQIRTESRTAGGAPPKRKLNFGWGDSKLSFDVTHGVSSGVKGWLRKQLDDEQTIRVPAHNLIAGTRVRIHISQGLAGEKRQIEITLPTDFVVGRPIRLKGLGKKLGPWTGDLYLRILARI